MRFVALTVVALLLLHVEARPSPGEVKRKAPFHKRHKFIPEVLKNKRELENENSVNRRQLGPFGGGPPGFPGGGGFPGLTFGGGPPGFPGGGGHGAFPGFTFGGGPGQPTISITISVYPSQSSSSWSSIPWWLPFLFGSSSESSSESSSDSNSWPFPSIFGPSGSEQPSNSGGPIIDPGGPIIGPVGPVIDPVGPGTGPGTGPGGSGTGSGGNGTDTAGHVSDHAGP